MSVTVERYRYTVDEYQRMAEVGILGEDDRVELLEGEITVMTPIGRRHAACVDRLNRLLVERCGEAAIVRIQGPVRLSDHSEPEPDVALLRPRDDFYASGHPGPADVFLVIEVADSSLDYDRKIKLPLYAKSGVAACWIIDLGRGSLDVYGRPGAADYTERRTYLAGELVSLQSPPLRIGVDEILPS